MKEKLHTLIDEVMAANKRGVKTHLDFSLHSDGTHYICVFLDNPWRNLAAQSYYRDGQWLDHGYDIDKLINDVKSL